MRRNRFRAALLVGALVGAPVPAAAQDARVEPGTPAGALIDREPYTLVYDHVTGEFSLLNARGKRIEGWRGRADGQRVPAPVPPDRPLEVVVKNANTLLYEYSVEAEPVGDRTVRGCRDIGRDFVSSGFMVSTRALLGDDGGDLPSLGDVWQDVEQFRDAAPAGGDGDFGFGGGGASRAELMGAAEAEYRDLEGLVERVEHLSVSLEDSLRWIATFAESTPMDSLVQRLQTSIESDHPGLSDPRLVPRVLVAARQDVAARLAPLLPEDGAYPADEYASRAMSLNRQAERQLEAAEPAVRRLQEQLLDLRQAAASSRKQYTLLPSGTYRRIVVHMEPTEREGFRPREGAAQVYTRPHVSLLCNVSFGLTWMEPPPSYQTDSDGMIQNDSGDDDIRTSAGLFLHLAAPDVPLLGALGVLAGLGIGTSAAPDLYLGGTMRLFRPVLVNAGAVWQRQEVLPDGVVIGDPATSPDMLNDLDREYQPTLFVGVSYAP